VAGTPTNLSLRLCATRSGCIIVHGWKARILPANVHKRDLHQIHFMAWKKGLKSLYYCRSMSIQRADNVSEKVKPLEQAPSPSTTDYDECLACE
jgi:ribonucleotide reductase alpha subunit